MTKAVWNGRVIAETDDPVRLEGNVYFPMDSVERAYLDHSDTTTRCPWKGKAQYYDLVVGDRRNLDAAWYYPKPLLPARKIRDHVAFWQGVEIVE